MNKSIGLVISDSYCGPAFSLWITGGTARFRSGLPITLGSTSDEVRKALGGPTERYRPPNSDDTVETIRNPGKDEKVIEWYYSSGIVGIFDRDRLTGITLHTYTDYQGFLPYSGDVIDNGKLTDARRQF